MISLDGAALLASLYPIALFLLAFESRSLLRTFRPKGTAARLMYGVAFLLPLTSSLTSEYFCVDAAASGTQLDGFRAIWVGTTAAVLATETSVAMAWSVSKTLWNDQ